ncbi:DUF1801 domain-containing protein [Oscillatoria amoena NRMC-F 0135]|nr:DUF1801 domain-containing protein [Oscillatoria amoena NRMC-F 0135]
MKIDKRQVEEVIQDLPKGEQVIVKRLRALIIECLPKATEKNSYGVPFYTRNRMICFIWPPSIYWGAEKKKYQSKGVTLGFCQGNLFANEKGILLKEGRKQVFCMYFRSVQEIDEDQIRALLFEAEMIDEEFGKKRKKKP